MLFKIVLCIGVILVLACGAGEWALPEMEIGLSVHRPAFSSGENIPAKYACEGEKVSPALNRGEPPPNSQFFAPIVDDSDAPGGYPLGLIQYPDCYSGASRSCECSTGVP